MTDYCDQRFATNHGHGPSNDVKSTALVTFFFPLIPLKYWWHDYPLNTSTSRRSHVFEYPLISGNDHLDASKHQHKLHFTASFSASVTSFDGRRLELVKGAIILKTPSQEDAIYKSVRNWYQRNDSYNSKPDACARYFLYACILHYTTKEMTRMLYHSQCNHRC